jgi:hypothetical protein
VLWKQESFMVLSSIPIEFFRILLESKIQLMLNPNEEDHQKLEWMIHEMMQALQRSDEKGRQDFIATHPEVIKLSRLVFKREWNRVKDNIELGTATTLENAQEK